MPEPAAPRPATAPASGLLLLVDDEEDLVAVLRDALELALPGYRVATATTAAAALAAAEAIAPAAPSLVCVDQRLGRESGIELLSELRRRYPAVPAMLFTGQATPEVAGRAKGVGARVVWKPLRLAQWLGEVRELLAGTAP